MCQINPKDIKFKKLFFKFWCLSGISGCTSAKHVCELVTWACTPLPFVNIKRYFWKKLIKVLSLAWSEPAGLTCPLVGVTVFEAFLRSEFSDENLQFYMACEQYRHSSNKFSLQRRAKAITETYIQPGAPREVQSSICGCLSVCY